MKKSALIMVFAWLLWTRIENPPNETPSWMPLNTFDSETACKQAAVKAANAIVNSQKAYTELTLIRPMKQRNVVLAYFNNRRVGTTIYSCADVDPATPRLELPSSSTIPSYQ